MRYSEILEKISFPLKISTPFQDSSELDPSHSIQGWDLQTLHLQGAPRHSDVMLPASQLMKHPCHSSLEPRGSSSWRTADSAPPALPPGRGLPPGSPC